MRIILLCLAFGTMCADAAFAQQVINPVALARTARAALPQNRITAIPAQRLPRYARQRLMQHSHAFIEGSALIDWLWAI